MVVAMMNFVSGLRVIGYKERKAQKAQIKYELAPIAWHPDRYLDWCIDEDEKRDYYFDRFYNFKIVIKISAMSYKFSVRESI